MTFNMLMNEMTMASLLNLTGNGDALEQDRLQAAEAVLARLPSWDGQILELDTDEQLALAVIVREAA